MCTAPLPTCAVSRHRAVMNLYEKRPSMAADVFIAPSASVIGDVILNDSASVWYGAVVRADVNPVSIGGYTNIQDRAIVHAANSTPTGFKANCAIGSWCSIGQGAVLRACTVEDYCIIGAGSILLEGSLVEKHAILEPGSVLPAGARIPSGEVRAHPQHSPCARQAVRPVLAGRAHARCHPSLRRALPAVFPWHLSGCRRADVGRQPDRFRAQALQG